MLCEHTGISVVSLNLDKTGASGYVSDCWQTFIQTEDALLKLTGYDLIIRHVGRKSLNARNPAGFIAS